MNFGYSAVHSIRPSAIAITIMAVSLDFVGLIAITTDRKQSGKLWVQMLGIVHSNGSRLNAGHSTRRLARATAATSASKCRRSSGERQLTARSIGPRSGSTDQSGIRKEQMRAHTDECGGHCTRARSTEHRALCGGTVEMESHLNG